MVEAVAKKQEEFLEPKPEQVIKARADLTRVLQAKLNNKPSIYDHIVKVVDRIVTSCPDQAIERFEEISYLIKNGDLVRLEDFVKCSDQRNYAIHDNEMADASKEGIEELRKMFPAQSSAAAGGEEEGGGEGGSALGLVQDLTSLNRHVFNQAGIELGEYGSLILQKSIK